jgi:hypothetical protein
MATVKEHALCVGWLFETKSVTQTQRNYRTQFNKQPLSDYAIRDWQWRFLETGSVHDRKRSSRPGVSDVWKQSVHCLYKALQNPHVELRFQSFTVICRKPHVASSICLCTTIFQNPKWTLWTHCSIDEVCDECWEMNKERWTWIQGIKQDKKGRSSGRNICGISCTVKSTKPEDLFEDITNENVKWIATGGPRLGRYTKLGNTHSMMEEGKRCKYVRSI